jgi:hypothetical protein
MADELYDAPNQQVVRADGSAPWDEGDGGSTAAAPKDKDKKPKAKNDDDGEDK